MGGAGSRLSHALTGSGSSPRNARSVYSDGGSDATGEDLLNKFGAVLALMEPDVKNGWFSNGQADT